MKAAATAVLLLFTLLPAAYSQVAPCVNGLATIGGVSYNCSNVDLMSHVPLDAMGALETGNDVWGWTDPETGREYALMGLDNGTFFVDVTSPETPLLMGTLPTATTPRLWRDMKVYANHAFIGSEAFGHGLQVFDLTRLRNLQPQASRVFSTDVTYTGTDPYTLGSSHNVVINEDTGFAYVVGARDLNGDRVCAAGLYMVDINDPQNPAFAGCFAADGYTHDAQCVIYDGPDPTYQGQEICFAANEDTVTLVDVTDKAAPVMISQTAYPNVGYTHQGWLTEDKRYFLVNDELDERIFDLNTRTLIFDVSNLQTPMFIGAYLHPTRSVDHNLYIVGDHAFQANYTSGLRILNIASLNASGDLGGISTIGYFNTYRFSDCGAQVEVTCRAFRGAWSNYPFFASGVVLVSDIEGGLFVVKPTNIGTSTPPDPSEPLAVELEAFPNPFASQTIIRLATSVEQEVRIEVFDVLGRRVALVHDGVVSATSAQEIPFDGSSLPGGVYVVRASGEAFSRSIRISIIR